jgi:hypothetical protein
MNSIFLSRRFQKPLMEYKIDNSIIRSGYCFIFCNPGLAKLR